MLRKALYDYFRAFHTGNFKKFSNDYWGWYWIFYLLIGAPINWALTDKSQNLIIYYLGVLPCIWMIMGSGCVPLALPKVMFLCPMQKEERREYVKCLFWINLMVPIIMAGCMQVIESVIFHKVNIFYWSNLFALAAMSASLLLYPDASLIEKGRSDAAYKPIARGFNIANIIIGALHIYIVILAKNDGGQFDLGVCIYFTASTIVQLILTALIVRKNKALIIEEAIDYEASFTIHKEAKK